MRGSRPGEPKLHRAGRVPIAFLRLQQGEEALAFLLTRPLVFAHGFQQGASLSGVFVLAPQGNKQRLLLRELPLTFNYIALHAP